MWCALKCLALSAVVLVLSLSIAGCSRTEGVSEMRAACEDLHTLETEASRSLVGAGETDGLLPLLESATAHMQRAADLAKSKEFRALSNDLTAARDKATYTETMHVFELMVYTDQCDEWGA